MTLIEKLDEMYEQEEWNPEWYVEIRKALEATNDRTAINPRDFNETKNQIISVKNRIGIARTNEWIEAELRRITDRMDFILKSRADL